MNNFFIPGPVTVSDDILQELTRPTIGHRGKEYSELHGDVIARMKKLFGWENYHVFLVTSSATGVMEGAIKNCVNDKVLHTVCGAFSELWHEISIENGKHPIAVSVPWGKAIKPEMVREALLNNKDLEAVTITYCETSTGVLNPLPEICQAVKELAPNTLIMVDAVSAFGGAPLEMKKWGIDVMVFGVQKTFALPPGLAIAVVSERALQKSRTVKNKGHYFNFEMFAKYNEKNNTPSTPAIPLIYALRRQLERIEEEGVQERYNRHQEMLNLIHGWTRQSKVKFFSEASYQSPTVSTLEIPDNMTVQDFVAAMKEKGFVISAGYGEIKDTTFRIGHMGEHIPENIERLMKGMNEVISVNK